jgi:pyruvate dehydrogenase E1 component alpha subunit
MRMHGHGAHDDMKYVPKALVEEWRKKDPIDRQSARVAALGVDVDALRDEVKAEVDRAAEVALAGPMPAPETATDDVFHPRDAPEILLQDGAAPWSGHRS